MPASLQMAETYQLRRARHLLELKGRIGGMPKPKSLPALTERECALLALQFDLSFDWVRQVFPIR